MSSKGWRASYWPLLPVNSLTMLIRETWICLEEYSDSQLKKNLQVRQQQQQQQICELDSTNMEVFLTP